ncbi:hypothetical protein ACFSYD_03635 [Paracoccus aerius]
MADRKILLIGSVAALALLATGGAFLASRGGNYQFAQCQGARWRAAWTASAPTSP